MRDLPRPSTASDSEPASPPRICSPAARLSDLIFKIAGTTDQLTIQNYFTRADGFYRIDELQFADGTLWDQTAIKAIDFQVSGGSDGNDNLQGFETDDVIHGGNGNDTIRGGPGNDRLFGDAGADLVYGEDGNDVLDAGEDAEFDTLSGDNGADTLIDGESMLGGTGADTYVLTKWKSVRIQDALDAAANIDVLQLAMDVAASDLSVMRSFDDLVLRNNKLGGDLTITSFYLWQNTDFKIDEIRFADGTVWDIAQVFALTDSNQRTAGDDRITGFRWDDTIDALGGNDQVFAGSGNDTLFGGAGDDWLEGQGDNDTLDGGSGKDLLKGGFGQDIYTFGRGYGQDTLIESGSSTTQTDVLRLAAGVATSAVTLLRNGDDLVLSLDQSATQIAVRNYFLTIGDYKIEQIAFADGTLWDATQIAARTISGTPNAFTGTSANNTYTVDDARDTIAEGVGQGIDTVLASVSYTLPTNVENLTLTGYLNTRALGNELANTLTGNAGNNVFNGPDPIWWDTQGAASFPSAWIR